MKKTKKLTRSKSNKMVAGVCGGIAEYMNIDPTVIRIIWVIISLFTGVFLGLLAYIICWIIVPEE